MSRTQRRASKQIDYAAFGDGEDEESLDLNAEDEEDEVRPKKREKREPRMKKEANKKRNSVVIDGDDDDVVLVADDDDDFDLGRRIIQNINQKIPVITKQKKNVIDEDEVFINLEEDDPPVTFRNLPKIGGQTLKVSAQTLKGLSAQEQISNKESKFFFFIRNSRLFSGS